MPKIKNVETNEIIAVSQQPVFSGGIWECGDQRFIDPTGALFEVVSPASSPVSVIEFKLLFSISERVAINAARATDPVIDDFYKLLDDPRTETVNLALPAVAEMLAYLVQQTLLSADRAAEILAYRP